jgi:hypothetical protein
MSIIAKMNGILAVEVRTHQHARNFVFECQHDRLRALGGARRIFEPAKTLKKLFFVFSRYSRSLFKIKGLP